MQVYVMTHERMTTCGMIMNVLVLSDHRSPSKSLDFEPPPPPQKKKKEDLADENVTYMFRA